MFVKSCRILFFFLHGKLSGGGGGGVMNFSKKGNVGGGVQRFFVKLDWRGIFYHLQSPLPIMPKEIFITLEERFVTFGK